MLGFKGSSWRYHGIPKGCLLADLVQNGRVLRGLKRWTPLATSVRSTTSTGWSEVQGGWCMSHHCTPYWSQASVGLIHGMLLSCRTAQYWKRFRRRPPLLTHEKRFLEYFICHIADTTVALVTGINGEI